jgi:hypothetical protein
MPAATARCPRSSRDEPKRGGISRYRSSEPGRARPLRHRQNPIAAPCHCPGGCRRLGQACTEVQRPKAQGPSRSRNRPRPRRSAGTGRCVWQADAPRVVRPLPVCGLGARAQNQRDRPRRSPRAGSSGRRGNGDTSRRRRGHQAQCRPPAEPPGRHIECSACFNPRPRAGTKGHHLQAPRSFPPPSLFHHGIRMASRQPGVESAGNSARPDIELFELAIQG